MLGYSYKWLKIDQYAYEPILEKVKLVYFYSGGNIIEITRKRVMDIQIESQCSDELGVA